MWTWACFFWDLPFYFQSHRPGIDLEAVAELAETADEEEVTESWKSPAFRWRWMVRKISINSWFPVVVPFNRVKLLRLPAPGRLKSRNGERKTDWGQPELLGFFRIPLFFSRGPPIFEASLAQKEGGGKDHGISCGTIVSCFLALLWSKSWSKIWNETGWWWFRYQSGHWFLW